MTLTVKTTALPSVKHKGSAYVSRLIAYRYQAKNKADKRHAAHALCLFT